MQAELPLQDKNDYLDLSQDCLDLFCNFIPAEVCHYTRRETAIEKILASKELRLGQLAFTNDPRESKVWNVARTTWPHEIVDDPSEHKDQVNRIRSEEWMVLCMACHNNPNLNFYGNITQEHDHIKYGFSHSRMWSQYAGDHKGVCLVFDGKKLDENINNYSKTPSHIFHGFVEYNYGKSIQQASTWDLEFQDEQPIEHIRKSLRKHYDSHFLLKSEEWKTEHEFRWLVHAENASEIFISIEKALKAIIVGVDFPKVYEINLIAVAKELNIPVGRIRWENGKPFVYRDQIYKP